MSEQTNNQTEEQEDMFPYTTEELSDLFDHIQIALQSVKDLFTENIGVPEDDEDIQVIKTVIERITELV